MAGVAGSRAWLVAGNNSPAQATQTQMTFQKDTYDGFAIMADDILCSASADPLDEGGNPLAQPDTHGRNAETGLTLIHDAQ